MSFLFSVLVTLLISIGGQMDGIDLKRGSSYDDEKQISEDNTTCCRAISVTGYRRVAYKLPQECCANFFTAHAIFNSDLIAVSLEEFKCDDRNVKIQVFSGQNGVLFFMTELKCGRANTMPLLLTGSQWILIVAVQRRNHEKNPFEFRFNILTYSSHLRSVDVDFKNPFLDYNWN